MMTVDYSRPPIAAAFVFSLAVAVACSGCTLLGLGAAAGAAVGGCSVLDSNEDDQITQAELRAGIFDSWDADDDDALTEAEFEAGTNRGTVYDEISNDFDAWDDDGDETLSESEFEAGVAETDEEIGWADEQCDDLGL